MKNKQHLFLVIQMWETGHKSTKLFQTVFTSSKKLFLYWAGEGKKPTLKSGGVMEEAMEGIVQKKPTSEDSEGAELCAF